MKKHQQAILIRILILLIIVLSGLCLWLYFKKQTPTVTPEKRAILERQSDTPAAISPSTNSSDNQQQTAPGDTKPAQNDHRQPSKLSISHQGFNEAGDYELRVFVDYLTKPGAKCQLFLNQQALATVELQNLPTSSICKGFRIAKNQLRPDNSQFRVVFTDGQFKDEISGEVK